MRIALLATRSDVYGGAVVHVRDLCLGLIAAGVDAQVLIGGEGPFARHLRDRGVPVHSVPHLERAIQPVADLRALQTLTAAIRRLRPDVVHGHTAKAGWLGRVVARRLGLPFVYTPHGWPFLDGVPTGRRTVYLAAERLAARLPGLAIDVCESERRAALAHGVGAPEDHVVIFNGVADVAADRLAVPDRSPPTLISIARFEPQKDHGTLLQALGTLTDLPWEAALLGDGPLRSASEKLTADLGLTRRVRFVGEVDDADRWLGDAQLFALASNWEGLPLTILEAMRAGLPTVASAVGGIPEAVAHGSTGLLVEPGRVADFALALRRLLADPAARHRFGAAGRRRYAERFTFERMLADVITLYERVNDGARARPARPADQPRSTPVEGAPA